MIAKSIRVRIQIWHTLLLSSLMAGLLSAFYWHEREILEREFDASLMQAITSVIPRFGVRPAGGPRGHSGGGLGGPEGRMHRRGPPPAYGAGLEGVRPSEDDSKALWAWRDKAAEELVGKGRYVVSMAPDGRIVYASPNAPESVAYPQPETKGVVMDSVIREVGTYRECIHYGPSMDVVILGASASEIEAKLDVLAWQLAGGGLAVVLVGFLIGWGLVGRSLRPLKSVTRTAQGIAGGDLSKRIDDSETDTELGQMVGVLNDTFAKLESSFDQQVRFTADASHELRTPVSVILAKCQFALMRQRSAEKYREALETCEASAQHIRALVESLLELARVDSGEFAILKTKGDLAEVAESCVHMLRTLAEEKQIDLRLDLQAAPGEFDAARMHQVGINLISNAIKYTGAGGIVEVTTGTESGQAVFEVSDTGPGIHGEDIPHLFDRFYRSSKERLDEQKSTGLGLAITKAIVDAHGATLRVRSVVGEGSTFTVRFV